jgi:dihydroflavonol-4-reductase
MKVLVTGANGHLGTNLVTDLLASGHRVRGSVRDLRDPGRTQHLSQLGPVELVEADLDRTDTLRTAVAGQDAIIHTAAIYQLHAPGRATEIIRASVGGVESVMRAAAEAGVRRVILTSSTTTLPLVEPRASPVDEAAWTDDLRVPYFRAKTEGERRAWQLAEELGIDLATVLPGAFGGPGFQRNTPTIDLVEAIMDGALRLGAPPINYPWVDVRDVARAHRLVLETGASGRFIAVNDRQPTLMEIAQTMHAIDRTIPNPMMTLPSFTMPLLPYLESAGHRVLGIARFSTPELVATLSGRVWRISNEKSRRELGWAPEISIKQSLSDTIDAIRTRPRSP